MRTVLTKSQDLLLAFGALWAASATAEAYPVELSLENVVFSDGGTASGTIDLTSTAMSCPAIS